jgi:hypothetical protein
MSQLMISKAFNLSPLIVTGNYVMQPNQYNVMYTNIGADSILTLPVITTVLDGFPVYIHNEGPAVLTVVPADMSDMFVLLDGDTLFLTADVNTDTWKVLLGPIASGGSSGIVGPLSSTNNAIVLWNGTSGSTVENSNITIIGNSLSTASGDLTITSSTGTVNFNGGTLTNIGTLVADSITNTSGTSQTVYGSKVVILGASSTNILVIPLPPNSSSIVSVDVSITNETDGTSSSAYSTHIRAKNMGGTITTFQYGTLVDFDASLAAATILLTSTGSNLIIQGSGVSALTTGYQAVAIVNGIVF